MNNIILTSYDPAINLELNEIEFIIDSYTKTEGSRLGFCDRLYDSVHKRLNYNDLTINERFDKIIVKDRLISDKVSGFIIRINKNLGIDYGKLLSALNDPKYSKVGISFYTQASSHKYRFHHCSLQDHWYNYNNLGLRFLCCELVETLN